MNYLSILVHWQEIFIAYIIYYMGFIIPHAFYEQKGRQKGKVLVNYLDNVGHRMVTGTFLDK